MPEQAIPPALVGSQRIVIIGTSGAGKTTLARQIAARLNIPHVELDSLHWEPNWQEARDEVFRERVFQALTGPRWVVDGNYSKVREHTWGQADTLIWLDYSLPVVLSRVVRRTLHRVSTRQELWNGNREQWRNLVSLKPENNIILWALTRHNYNRRKFPPLLAQPDYAHLRVVHLTSPAQTRALLQSSVKAS